MKALSVAGAVSILVLAAIPAFANDFHPPFAPIVGIGGQTRLIYPDFPAELLVTEAETAGRLGMVVVYSKPLDGPGASGIVETKLTETYYVLESQHRFGVGDDVFEGGPGTIIVNPPNVPHGFTYIGTGIGKLLIIYTPADGSHGTGFFTQWAEQSTRSPAWIAKTNTAYGIDRPAP